MLDLLERDHRRVESMFARSALQSGEARLAAVGELATALTVHAQVEESEVYPAIDRALGTPGLVDRAREEHAEMKDLLNGVTTATTGDEVVANLRQLQLVVQAHVAREEGEIFPAFRAGVSSKVLRDLTEQAREALTTKQPTPSSARR